MQVAMRPSLLVKGTLSKCRFLGPLGPPPGALHADEPPADSCTLQFETNLPVTALLQGSKGHGESMLSTFTAARSRGAQLSSPDRQHTEYALPQAGPVS